MSTTEAAPLLAHRGRRGTGSEDGAPKVSHGSAVQRARAEARLALESRFVHYGVVFLVVVDLVMIFAEFLIQLFRCEHECRSKGGRGEIDESSDAALLQAALGIVSLIFSCAFMLELVISLWAFGTEYFGSAFRVFDGTVIVVGFLLDVCLRGVLEEVGSVVIVLRLWRVFKIIGELSAQAGEQVADLDREIEQLKEENRNLQETIKKLRKD